MGQYNLQTIEVNGKFFVSLRGDQRGNKEVHSDGIQGYNAGHRAPIYDALYNAQLNDVKVKDIELGLPKSLGLAKKAQMVEAFKMADVSLNVK